MNKYQSFFMDQVFYFITSISIESDHEFMMLKETASMRNSEKSNLQ